jgi:hypothetical protein
MLPRSWSDEQITPGSQSFREIKLALADARVAVLLVTPISRDLPFWSKSDYTELFLSI